LTKAVCALSLLSLLLLGLSIAALVIANNNNNGTSSGSIYLSTSADGSSSIPLFETEGYWTGAPTLPVASLTDHVVLADYNGNYSSSAWILGGAIPGDNGTETVVDTVYEFDSLTAQFKPKKPMPTPRYRFSAALLDNKIYVTGGLSKPDDVDAVTITPGTAIYDIATDTWTDLPTASPGTPRTDACMTPAGGKLILAGGYSQGYDKTLASAEQFDPATNTWTPLPTDMPSPRGDLACASLSIAPNAEFVGNLTDNTGNDVAVFIGGYYDPTNSFTPGDFVTNVEQYDPATEKWSSLAPVLHARGDRAVCRLPDNRLLTLGGETATNDRNQVASNLGAMYLPGDNEDIGRWISVSPMPFGRFRFGCAYLPGGNGVYIFGGATTSICTKNASGEEVCEERGGKETVFKFVTDEEKANVFLNGLE
jgi:N-acetylneuraminic acid mutarotase